MAIISVFYSAFGYLALLGAILWGMLLAAAVPAYMLFDALWAARKTEAAQASRRALSLQRERVAG